MWKQNGDMKSENMERVAKRVINDMGIYCDDIAMKIVKLSIQGKKPCLIFNVSEERFDVVDSETAKNYVVVDILRDIVNVDDIVQLYKKVIKYGTYTKTTEEELEKAVNTKDVNALQKLMENDMQDIDEYIIFLVRRKGLSDFIYYGIFKFFTSNISDIYKMDNDNLSLYV